MRFETPTLTQDPANHQYAPSWEGVDKLAGPSGFINDEHRGIYEATKDLPGWQDPGDSLKLYEAAYFSGAVILEVGVFGGRSATVELRGALAAQKAHDGPAPQFYGVDPDLNAYSRTMGTLRAQGLRDRALMYIGDLRQFLAEIPIVPTMVFVDGSHEFEGVWADLECLSRWLVPGTAVMCHDYSNTDVPVKPAIDEWVARGAYDLLSVSNNTAVLRATGLCRGTAPRGLSEAAFRATIEAMAPVYEHMKRPGPRPDVAHLTHGARFDLGLAVGKDMPAGEASGAAKVAVASGR